MSATPWFVTADMLRILDQLALANELDNAVQVIRTHCPYLTMVQVIELLTYWRSLQ